MAKDRFSCLWNFNYIVIKMWILSTENHIVILIIYSCWKEYLSTTEQIGTTVSTPLCDIFTQGLKLTWQDNAIFSHGLRPCPKNLARDMIWANQVSPRCGKPWTTTRIRKYQTQIIWIYNTCTRITILQFNKCKHKLASHESVHLLCVILYFVKTFCEVYFRIEVPTDWKCSHRNVCHRQIRRV